MGQGPQKILVNSDGQLQIRWTVTDNLIQFSFPTIKDEQDFISPDTDLVYKIYTENNGRYLKLSNEKTNSWYLLARISQ